MVIGGLDEVGWGALAGPVISVVAVFRDIDLTLLPPGVTDSKKLDKPKREALFEPLIAAAYDVGIGHAWPWEVDSLSPAEALHLSYRRAWEEIHPTRRPELLIVDGSNRVRGLTVKQQVEPKADFKYQQVSAASIIAKVFRDRIMDSYASQRRAKGLPDYDWGSNSGYGSAAHMEAIKKFGLLINENNYDEYIHRRRYCKRFLIQPSR